MSLWNEWIGQLIKHRVKEKDRQSGYILNMGMSWSSSPVADSHPEGTFRFAHCGFTPVATFFQIHSSSKISVPDTMHGGEDVEMALLR